MSRYEEGITILEERCGKGKETIISLATMAVEPNGDEKMHPGIRYVCAYYEDGIFYVVTSAKSEKMRHIAQNPTVAVTACFEWFCGVGTGENLGWILESKNAELRDKLRTAFASWYEEESHEEDENCCILAIRLAKGTIITDHGVAPYKMDFVNKVETS